MNADMANARWDEMRGDVQQKWGRLTNSDLDQVQGQLNKLVGLIEDRYGYSPRKAQAEVNRFLSRYGIETGDMAGAASGLMAGVQRSMNDYPLAFVAAGLVLALVLVGLVWKPFSR